MPDRRDQKFQAPGRPFWSGTISFGLVSIPVELVTARRKTRTSLRMVAPGGTRLARKFYCSAEEKPLSPDELIRGYELPTGEIVPVSDDELEALAPEKTRDIDLTRFVPREQVSPMYFEQSYYLIPGRGGSKAYHLLAEVMERTGRVGIATFVLREKEHLVAIIAENGVLSAETMRFAGELRRPEAMGIPDATSSTARARAKANAKLVKRFEAALQAKATSTLPLDELADEDARRLRELATAKARRGEDVVEGDAITLDDEEGGKVIDLMQILKQRLGPGAVVKPATRDRTKTRAAN